MDPASATAQSPKVALWTVYFVFLLLVFVLGTVLGPHSPLELLKTIFFGFGLVALWGLIRGIAIGWRLFWVVYFCLVMAGVAYTIGNLAFGSDAPWPLSLWLFVLGGLLVTVPQWVALWLYAFRRPGIWAKDA